MPVETAKLVYALVGSDPYLQIEKLRGITGLMPKDVQRSDFEGDNAELASVLDECRSFAMFGGGKLVVVRDADDFISKYRESLEDYCAKPSDSATLVFRVGSMPANTRIYKAIAKTGKIEDCNPPKDGRAVQKWIVDHAKDAHQVQITPPAASELFDLIGADLGRLDTELAKLALASDGKPIRPEHVNESVVFQRDREMWDLTNALATGDTAEALRRWRQLLAGDSSTEFRAVTWLGMWLEKVRGAAALKKKGMNPFQIAGALKIFPREMQQPFLKTADRMGAAGAARGLDLLAEIDRQSKTGVGDAAANVERFILQMAV